jgi:hypothetical protein
VLGKTGTRKIHIALSRPKALAICEGRYSAFRAEAECSGRRTSFPICAPEMEADRTQLPAIGRAGHVLQTRRSGMVCVSPGRHSAEHLEASLKTLDLDVVAAL